MSRYAKPVEINKKHLTKAEIEARKQQLERFKVDATLKPSVAVKKDAVAYKEFKRLKKLYEEIDFINGFDENTINRYCTLISQEQSILNMLEDLKNAINSADEAEAASLINTYNSTNTQLLKIRDMILKLEDRMFLNPVSRLKNVPKKEEEKEPESKWAKFSGGMSG